MEELPTEAVGTVVLALDSTGTSIPGRPTTAIREACGQGDRAMAYGPPRCRQVDCTQLWLHARHADGPMCV